MVIANFIEEDYHRKLRAFRKDWIKHNRCECVKDLLPNRVINCKHINVAIGVKFKGTNDFLWNSVLDELISEADTPELADYIERYKV